MTEALLALALVAVAPPVRPMPADTLEDLKWKHRLLIVLYDDGTDPRLVTQLRLWQDEEDGTRERELLLILVPETGKGLIDSVDLPADEATRIRDRFGVGSRNFAVVLVGKDGTAKHRWEEPAAMADVFQRIDSMPMRRREMRDRGQ